MVVGVMEKADELVAWSRAVGDAKSAAKISRVRFADVRTRCSTVLGGCADVISAMMSSCGEILEVRSCVLSYMTVHKAATTFT